MENSLRSLLWLGKEQGKKMKRGGEQVVRRVTRVDAGLAMRVHVCSQCDYVPRKKKGVRKKERADARRKSKGNLLCSRIKMPRGRVVKFTLAESQF